MYPFDEVVARKNSTDAQIIENIDIGGPAMLRAAAKNYKRVTVLIDPKDYEMLAEKINLLLNNSKLSASIADAGKALIENNNNWIVEMEKVNNIYNSLLHQ